MAPRFIEIRRVPNDNETVGAVFETFGTECYEKIEATVDATVNMIRNISTNTPEWPDGWSINWPSEWSIGLPVAWSAVLSSHALAVWNVMSALPKSSVVCFLMAVVCLIISMCTSVYLSRREWRRLRGVYET